MAAQKAKRQALKPKMVKKNLKVRLQVKRLNAEMGEIRKDQKCIGEKQIEIGVQFGEIETECHQLKLETEMIVKQAARTQIKLALMFKILKAREVGDFTEAATLTNFLRFVPAATMNLFRRKEQMQAQLKSRMNVHSKKDTSLGQTVRFLCVKCGVWNMVRVWICLYIRWFPGKKTCMQEPGDTSEQSSWIHVLRAATPAPMNNGMLY